MTNAPMLLQRKTLIIPEAVVTEPMKTDARGMCSYIFRVVAAYEVRLEVAA
jgi:hypothetical protein